MRIRTLLGLTTGAALGAGAMYLFDPEHGEGRRREARRGALRSIRHGAVRAAVDLRERGREVGRAALVGYTQARSGEPVDAALATTDPRRRAGDRIRP